MADRDEIDFNTATRIVDEAIERLRDADVGAPNMVVALVEQATELALSMERPKAARRRLIGIMDAWINLAKAETPEIDDDEPA
jgi:hypothetical protein